MMVGQKSLSVSGHETASKHEGWKFSSTSRLANYDGVTVQKPSNGITANDAPYKSNLKILTFYL
jgi:hypothetical protein